MGERLQNLEAGNVGNWWLDLTDEFVYAGAPVMLLLYRREATAAARQKAVGGVAG